MTGSIAAELKNEITVIESDLTWRSGNYFFDFIFGQGTSDNNFFQSYGSCQLTFYILKLFFTGWLNFARILPVG